MRSSSVRLGFVPRVAIRKNHREAPTTPLHCVVLLPQVQQPVARGVVDIIALRCQHLAAFVATSEPAFAAMYVTKAPVAASTTPSSKCAQPRPDSKTML